MRAPAPQWRLRSALIAVAVVALLLGALVGVRRHRERLLVRSRAHAQVAGRLHILAMTSAGEDEDAMARALLGARWHDEAAAHSRRAVMQPWIGAEPDPATHHPGCFCRVLSGGEQRR